MTKIMLSVLCAALMAVPAWAQVVVPVETFKGRDLALPSLQRIRLKARGADAAAPALAPGRVVPVKYREETGPGWNDPLLSRMVPQRPPNLQDRQASALLQRLVMFDSAHNGGKVTLSKENVQTLVVRLVQIDVNFVDTIDGKKWDDILKAVGDAMEADYPKTKDWGKTVETGIVTAVKALKDPHTSYLNEKQLKAFMESMKGSFVGIGAAIAEDAKGLKLEFIYPDSGAEAAGIKAGDIVTHVDGKSVAGQKPNEIAEKLRGDENTQVKVTVERGGQALPPFTVTRKKVSMPAAFSKSVAPGVGYVYWSQFGEDSDAKVLEHVRRLKANGAKSIILDVRGNPGGLVTAVSEIASEFLKDGQEVVSFRKQGQLVFKHITDGDGEFSDMPVAVLVNGGSASASEILAATMQDQRKGYAVIGSRSYGKGTQQSILPGADQGGLKITQSRWHRPNGGNIDAQHDPATGEKVDGTGGVMPDVEVALSESQAQDIAQQTAYELMGRPVPNKVADPVIEKAVEILKGAAKAG